jgi:CAAD domains of cyanobacterial aminoacyl-tRNA synthetase
MESELKQAEYSNNAPAAEPTNPSISMDQPGSLSSLSDNEQWREMGAKAAELLSSFPEYFGAFFTEYRKPIVYLGVIFGSIVSVKLTLAILSAINDIPLMEPALELIGLGYSAWFVYRFLLKASNRQELGQEFDKFKTQVMGGKK